MRLVPAATRTVGRRWARSAVCALAAATALTGLSTGSAAGAPTPPAGTRVVLESPATAEALPYESYGLPMDVWVLNRGAATLDSYKLTVDATSLKGIADVTACWKPADPVRVCDSDGIISSDGGRAHKIDLRRAKNAVVGASGEIRMTVESHGVQLATRTIKVTVPDPGVVLDRLERTPGGEKVKPGTSMKVTSGFTNYGATAKDAVGLHMLYDGLTPDEEFSNCEYSTSHGTAHGGGTVSCVFEGSFAVGGSYDLDLGSVTADTAELNGSLSVSYGKAEHDWGDEAHHRGTGRELRPTPRPASAPPGEPQERGVTSFRIDNTADLRAVGATVRQKKAGDPVRFTVGVRNDGPAGMLAWTGSEPGEDPPYKTRVYLPAGTETVTTPKACHEFTKHGVLDYYECHGDVDDYWIDPGQYTKWDFDLRVVDPAKLKPGRITVDSLPTDPDRANNTAAIVVRAPGDGSGTGGSGAGGTSGGSTGSGGTSGGDGNGGTGGGGGSTTTTTGGTGSGSMAATGAGSSVTLAAGASALALLLGGGLFLGLRRRGTR
ncbi:hypothetical protein ACICHK_22230 [Streptomyces sp. AHU1]|uniref:hypothetical protein n=1 Tax=Streptomyces sp. AHU1 TaxID=3377215 RepID=UPI003877C55F